MIHTVKHQQLSKWLIEKDVLVKEGRELSKQIEDLEAKRNTCGMKIQKLKDKIIPTAEKLIKPHLGEYGMLTTINIKGEDVDLEYIDQVEDFKKMLKERDKKNENTPK